MLGILKRGNPFQLSKYRVKDVVNKLAKKGVHILLSYYNRLSLEVYDMDKPVGHSFGDIEFYMERLADCHGQILEPATGTGRLLIPLLEKGLQVDGFDSSTDMLTLCRKNCEERGLHPLLFEAKMESFVVDKKYEAIIIPAGTFLLLHKEGIQFKRLKTFITILHMVESSLLIYSCKRKR